MAQVLLPVLFSGFLFAQPSTIPAPSAPNAAAVELKLSAKEIVDRGQQLLRGVKSSQARVVMTLVRPTFKRSLEIESFHEGKDKSFVIVHNPPKERGSRTLRLKHDIWSYRPDLEQTIKIPFSMMHSSWMGSDFSYEDMVKLDTFITEYSHRLLEKKPDPQKRGETLVTIELTPLPDAPVVWGRVIWKAVVSREGAEVIPVSEEDYNERGELIRSITLERIQMMDGRRMPTILTCIPLKKKDSKTVLKYKNFKFDVSVDPKIFTQASLEGGIE